MKRESYYEIYLRSPEECLRAFFDNAAKDLRYVKDSAFLYQSLRGMDGQTYGSYKAISKQMLEGRKYRIEFWDDQPSIHWLDVVHNPKTYKSEPIQSETFADQY